MSQWCTIESDPAVFNELIAEIGVKNIEVDEIYSLESAEQTREKSYGLIFLFKWRSEVDSRQILDPFESPVYFARQIVPNACATQAILSVLLNADGIDLGENLNDFRSFTCEIDSESKGIAIGNSTILMEAHNSFARPEPFLNEESKTATDGADAYHFIAYVPCHGGVYEIDGLKSGPIYLGDVGNDGDWYGVAKPAIEDRVNRYSATETHFALLSIGEHKSCIIEREAAALNLRLSALDAAVSTGAGRSTTLADGYTIADDSDGLAEQRSATVAALGFLAVRLEEQTKKLERQKMENVRRRHNYVPMAIVLLRELAKAGQLSPLVAAAKERQSVRSADK